MSTRVRQGERSCRQLLEEVFAYLDGELTGDRCQALERHLTACDCCGTLTGNLRKAIALCRLEGKRGLPASLRAGARRRVLDLLQNGDTPGRRGRKPAATSSSRRARSASGRPPAASRKR